ncbi:tRNA dihydrouridine synthase DusB [Nisaea nitritireducens]|uniref:tRNA dihydrouridine synthase DusB n=1 Tax=Nisaea nitritireducens TaxID=568392 RepID=UPI0018689E52|nr:tRNA dihydrouridine synthase DusB [Nisaea nitritireducens]
MTIEIGKTALDSPVFLAPMSGVTDRPFRRLVREFGCGLVVSEMIASAAVLRDVREEMFKIPDDMEAERPLAVQLAGWDPEIMAEAAKFNVDRGAEIIDINMGCPAKKVVNKLAGSALMRDEALAGQIMEAVVKAVPVPVTLKMRTGWDDSDRNAPRLARIAEDVGIQLLTVHGRTRCQMYNGHADWGFIREVKDTVSLPVVANGDIAALDDVDTCLAQSGADGVMIGRGAYGRPWFPAQVAAHIAGRPVPADPSVAERGQIMRRHVEDMLSHYGAALGLRMARKHIGWYASGIPGSAEFRKTVNNTMDRLVVEDAIQRFFCAGAEQDRRAA